MDETYTKLSKIFSAYSLILIIIGSLGNALAFLICLRKDLRKITTFVFLSFMCINNIVCLYVWNLAHFTLAFYDYRPHFKSLYWCRISCLVQNVTLEWAAWILVCVSIERYASIRIKDWRTSYFNPKKACYTAAILGSILFILNFHIVFTNGYEEVQNNTIVIHCYESKNNVFPAWQVVHGSLYSFIPFAILIVVDSLLIYRTVKSKTNSSSAAISHNTCIPKYKSMSITIILLTLSFILFTLPNSLAGGYYYEMLINSKNGYFYILVSDSLCFSYHGLNFILLIIFNKKFYCELKNTFIKCKSSKVTGFTQSSLNTF